MTVDELKAQLNALIKAIGTGVRTVSHSGKSVTYHSTVEMMRAKAMLEDQIARLEGRRRPMRYIRQSSKGY